MRQKLKAREWDELMSKRKLKVLDAVVIGCMWEEDKPSPQLLQPYAVCMLAPLHTEEPSTPEENASRQQRKEQCGFGLCGLSCVLAFETVVGCLVVRQIFTLVTNGFILGLIIYDLFQVNIYTFL